ncbi:MAG TPA: OmpA family protein [Polyangia bacterium]|jgi:peptidoglycan-associated lipoprotein
MRFSLAGGRLGPAHLFVLAAALVLGAGCGPKYPNCKGDKDCKDKEYCVSGKCQQCRPNEKDCPPGQECAGGACKAIAGFCTSDAQCPPDQSCLGNRCKACTADDQCGEGKCHNGRCQQPKSCVKDEDCAQDEDCVKGRCVSGKRSTSAGPTPSCALEAVYFDFNESVLTSNASDVLARDAACLKQAGRAAALEGRADPRGTEEYNLALSERRALAVKKHLENLGVPGGKLRTIPKGKTEASGGNEAGWAKDRRVDVKWD